MIASNKLKQFKGQKLCMIFITPTSSVATAAAIIRHDDQ